MTSITIDTLKFARRLREAGVPERQAEAEASALAELFAEQRDDLITRPDLREALEPLRTDLHLIKWILALVVAVTVIPAIKTLLA